MEYSVHGSLHSGSQHGGSLHSFGGSGHGPLTARGEGDMLMVSSANSPKVKNTFKQLGGLEDGWLIEMYYRAAVRYQRDVFDIGENELRVLFKQIVDFEEKRERRLHQILLAFVPRQRRLFKNLPDELKDVLDDLVGLRIDEESLQTIIDESIKDRSLNHLRSSFSHKSSIMNRSRLQNSTENEVEDIESEFGNPFESSLVLCSKIVELKPSRLGSIVNASWKVALSVVTSDGNFHLFELPESARSLAPAEAFSKLLPVTDFDKPKSWMQGRKATIIKSLTPMMTLNLCKCNIKVSAMRKTQCDIVEDKTQMSRIFHANAQRQKRCTLRLQFAPDMTEWVNLLEKTKTEILSKEVPRKSSMIEI